MNNLSSEQSNINFQLYDLIQECHNPKLLQEDAVHHIYNDGKITKHKRNNKLEFIELNPNVSNKYEQLADDCVNIVMKHRELQSIGCNFNKKMFPLANNEYESYAIVTLGDALKIREFMVNIMRLDDNFSKN